MPPTRSSHTLVPLLLAALSLATSSHAQADGARGAAAIDDGGALAKVRWLADDAREGRRAGSAGNEAAARWLIERLEALGLEPGGDPVATEGDGDRGEQRGWLQRFRHGKLAAHNVVAVLPGSAPEDEVGHIVIGAHYDHLGRGGPGSLALFGERNAIHNGADDNASGSAALLEIAEAFATAPTPPARSVVFVWFDAEELGLLGSQHYVREPRFPLRRCAAMFNLDMVGRGRDGRAIVLGATSGEGLADRVAGAARRHGLDLTVAPFMVPNSDHFSFYQRKVPVAFFTTGLHGDYHRPTDDAERVDAATLARIARTVYDVAAEIAADPSCRFAWHEVRSAPLGLSVLELLEGVTGREDFERLARLLYGPIAGATVVRGETGLEVLFVEPDSPLAVAGLRMGDRIVAVRGGLVGDRERSVGGLGGRLLLRAALVGPPAELAVRRGERRLTLHFPPRTPRSP